MSRRAVAVAQTRRRILEATHELHKEQGIAATSWDDIAARAGVGVGTVYRHFPSLDELMPACGELSMQIVALPDVRGLPARFEGLDTPAARIERLVEEAFGIYERGAAELWAIRRERDVHPRLAEDGEEIEAALGALVDTALAPLDVTPHDRALVRAMIDLNTWDALRAQEIGQVEAVTAIAEILTARMTKDTAGGADSSLDTPQGYL